MTTTPEPTRGVPRIEGDPAPTLRADHNALADWVRDNTPENNLLVPGSVAGEGVRVSARGRIDFTNATTISVDGVFTPKHRNYVVLLDVSSATEETDIHLVLRVNGVGSAANYDVEALTGRHTSVYASQHADTTSIPLQAWSGKNHWVELTLARPATTLPTIGKLLSFSTITPPTQHTATVMKSFLHRPHTAFDGFKITATTGTARITGMIWVYGYHYG